MLNEWEQRFPGRIESMFKAMQNVVPSHLADGQLYDFAGVSTQPGPVAMGDTAFDEVPSQMLSGENVQVITL